LKRLKCLLSATPTPLQRDCIIVNRTDASVGKVFLVRKVSSEFHASFFASQSLSRSRRHQRMHMKPVRCPCCDHACAEQKDMLRHVESYHTEWARHHWTWEKRFFL
jgi:uncharacterized C2H2 Zn-finger protein